MSSADAILGELKSLGVELIVVGDRLRYRPAARVTTQLVHRIQGSKAELLARLSPRPSLALAKPDQTNERLTPCRCCGGRDFWALKHVLYWVCVRCHEPLPARETLVWHRVEAASEVQHG